MSTVTRVQIAGQYTDTITASGTGATAHATASVTGTYTAGNTLVILVGAWYSGAGGGTNTPTVTDTRGNTFTQLNWVNGGHLDGGAIGMYMATNIVGGANTITFGVNGVSGFIAANVDAGLIVAEYSGFGPSPVNQNNSLVKQFGSPGNNPFNLSVTDCFGATATVLFGTPSGNGSISATMLQDVSVPLQALNVLVAGVRTYNGTPPLPTSTYQVFHNALTVAQPTSGGFMAFWEPSGPITGRSQPQVFVVQSDTGPATTGVSGVFATSPLSSTGGTSPVISITSPLPVANGGSGSASPSLVAGTNVTVTGSWPNQTIAASGGGGGAMVQIAQTTLGAPAATFTFSGIAGSYTSLRLVIVGRSAAAAASDNIVITVNGDTGNNYNAQFSGVTNATFFGVQSLGAAPASCAPGGAPGSTAIASIPGVFQMEFFGYALTAFYKGALANAGYRTSTGYWHSCAWSWMNTAAITSIVASLSSAANWVAGSQATLYGIT